MGLRHNNILPNVHLRKNWKVRVKTWLDQAGRKSSRRCARKCKAASIAPRPVDGCLRPAVRCPTVRYNTKVRAGRGFTLEELKAAGIRKKEAKGLGISVDHRRRNRCEESLKLNTERLLEYKGKLIVFPRKSKSPKKGDSEKSELETAQQLSKYHLIPVKNAACTEAPRAITSEEKELKAFETSRKAWKDARLIGVRAKRASAKAEQEALAEKK